MVAEKSLLQSVLVTVWNYKYITQISLLSLLCSADECIICISIMIK